MIRRFLLIVLLLSAFVFATAPVSAFKGGGGGRTEVVWSQDGANLAVITTLSAAPGVWLHDTNDWEAAPRQVWPVPDAPANSAATWAFFSPDGSVVATGHVDAKIRLWNMETLDQVGEISDLLGKVLMVKYSPDGSLLASVTKEDGLILWDATTYEQVASLPMPHVETNVVFSPDSSLLAFGLCDAHDPNCGISGITLWDTTKREEIAYISVPSGLNVALDLHFTPEGEQLAFRDRGDRIHVFNVADAMSDPEFTVLIEMGYEMDYNFDGTRIAAVVMGGSQVTVWDCEAHSQLWKSDNIQMTNIMEYFTHPQFSPGGSLVAAGTAAGAGAMVWDAETGELVARLKP